MDGVRGRSTTGGRTSTGVRTFAKLLVTHGFRLDVLYLQTTEYGLDGTEVGLGNGVGSKGFGRKGTKVGRTRGSGLSVGLRGITSNLNNEISELSSYYILEQYLH